MITNTAAKTKRRRRSAGTYETAIGGLDAATLLVVAKNYFARHDGALARNDFVAASRYLDLALSTFLEYQTVFAAENKTAAQDNDEAARPLIAAVEAVAAARATLPPASELSFNETGYRVDTARPLIESTRLPLPVLTNAIASLINRRDGRFVALLVNGVPDTSHVGPSMADWVALLKDFGYVPSPDGGAKALSLSLRPYCNRELIFNFETGDRYRVVLHKGPVGQGAFLAVTRF